MADLPPYRTPRWVKIIGIIALVLVLLVGIILLTDLGGEHGPGRHMPSGGAGSHASTGGDAGGTPFASHTLPDSVAEINRQYPGS